MDGLVDREDGWVCGCIEGRPDQLFIGKGSTAVTFKVDLTIKHIFPTYSTECPAGTAISLHEQNNELSTKDF